MGEDKLEKRTKEERIQGEEEIGEKKKKGYKQEGRTLSCLEDVLPFFFFWCFLSNEAVN